MFLRVVSFDIEVRPLKGQMPNPEKDCPVLLISCVFNHEFEYRDFKCDRVSLLLAKKNECKMISVVDENDVEKSIVLDIYDDEKVMINSFFDILRKCDIITGYNINGFDFVYLIDRCKYLGIRNVNIGNGDGTLYYRKHLSRGKGMSVVKVGGVTGKIIFDVLYLLRREDASNTFLGQYNLKRLKLEDVSREILGINKLEFSSWDMERYWVEGCKWDLGLEMVKYGIRDSEIVLELFRKFRLLDKFITLSRRSGKLIGDVIGSMGSGLMVENLLFLANKKEDRVTPSRSKSGDESNDKENKRSDTDELEGAEVFEPKIGMSENVCSADYKSLYSSLIMRHNLCYSTLVGVEDCDRLVEEGKANVHMDERGKKIGCFVDKSVYIGIIPRILESLMKERAYWKSKMKEAMKGSSEYLLYDATQNAVKILLNSFYGYSGDNTSRTYNWAVASSITANGRKQIRKTKEIIENEIGVVEYEGKKFKLDVVYGDSVTGDIPVVFFEKNCDGILVSNTLPIKNLYHYYYQGNNGSCKEIYVDSRNGLTLLKGVYRHKVSKDGYKIYTSNGYTKVTEDHSLYRNGIEIKPSELVEGSYIDIKDGVDIVKNIEKFEIKNEYVYDLTTDDGTFIAGLGNIIHHNTDSSYISVSHYDDGYSGGSSVSKDECIYCVKYVIDKVNEGLEKPMELAFENYIKRLFVIAKKRYSMLVVDDKRGEYIKSKGMENIRRDWCDMSTDAVNKITDYILKEDNLSDGIDKSVKLVKDIGRQLKRGEMDIKKLILTKKLTKPITKYDNKQAHVLVAIKNKERGRGGYEVGDRVEYVIVDNGKKLITEKAEDWRWAVENKLRIDYDYYINRQLIPPAMRILGLLGVSKEYLLVEIDEKQKTLTDWF